MPEASPNPRSGARDNGLRCAGYAAIGDLDPRVAEAMLEALRDHGIAAYVIPTPATRGGYLEMRLPAELTNRLFVDSGKVEPARRLIGVERQEEADSPQAPQATPSASDTQAPSDPPTPWAPPVPTGSAATSPEDVDAAWQQLLVSLQAPSSGVMPTWPSAENLPAGGGPRDYTVLSPDSIGPDSIGPDSITAGHDPALEDHYVPPPAPPLPALRPVTIASLVAIIAGILVLATQVDGGAWDWPAIIAIVAGGASLAWHVKEGPPRDSGWDDGAVV